MESTTIEVENQELKNRIEQLKKQEELKQENQKLKRELDFLQKTGREELISDLTAPSSGTITKLNSLKTETKCALVGAVLLIVGLFSPVYGGLLIGGGALFLGLWWLMKQGRI